LRNTFYISELKVILTFLLGLKSCLGGGKFQRLYITSLF